MSQLSALETEMAQLIIDKLNLENLTAEQIEPEAPLFREGLGLDSIDALEIALAIASQYGIQLKADDENNVHIFSSLRSLAGYIEKQRVK